MKSFSLRRMSESDLPGADVLRDLAGWNQTLEDWRRLRQLGPNGCFVATQDAQIVGTVTATCYGNELAWIGMMLVHPERRRQGIGAGLMGKALDYLRSSGVNCVRLDATPVGRPLYEKLGFIEEWSLTRWQRQAAPETEAFDHPASERPLREDDWAKVNEIDTAAFGVGRSSLLRSLAEGATTAVVWPAQGSVEGWGLLRPGARSDYIGPLACFCSEGALSLVRALLRAADGGPVIWDIPDRNQDASAAAQRFGFSSLRPLTRMRLGPDVPVSRPQAQFAIADPAVG